MRKHSAWLWAIVITAVIASFVVAYRPGSGSGGGGGNGGAAKLGHMYNEPITQTDLINAQKEAEISYFLSNAEWPDRPGRSTGFNVQQETYFRIFLVKKAEDLHIKIGDDEVAAGANMKLRALNRGEAVKVEGFSKQVLEPRRLAIADFERTVRHDLEIQQLYTLLGSSGALVTPQEARLLYLREYTEVSAQAVFFSASNYLSQVTVTPEVIAQYFTNQAANYRLPDRVQVTYVEFPLTNYSVAAASNILKMTNVNIDQEFEHYLAENGTNYFLRATNEAEARVKFRGAFLSQQERIVAEQAATGFATPLFETNRVEYMLALAKQRGLTVKTTEPFDSRNGPKEFSLPLQMVQRAFQLTEADPFTPAIDGETAVYVMALDKRFPSEVPSLESIHARVVADLTRDEATQMARQEAIKSYTIVTNALAAGKVFHQACLEAHVQPTLLPPFSIRTQTNSPAIEAHVRFDALKQAAFSILPRQAIAAGTEEGAMIVYVDSKFPVNEAKLSAELPGYLAYLRQRRVGEAFNFWFGHEIGIAMQDVSALQQQKPVGGAQ